MNEVIIPGDLAAQAAEAIGSLGDDAPLALKRLWGYLVFPAYPEREGNDGN